MILTVDPELVLQGNGEHMPSLCQWIKKYWVWGWHLLWESRIGNLLQKRNKDQVYFSFLFLLSVKSSFNLLFPCPPNLFFLFVLIPSTEVPKPERAHNPWHLDPLTHHVEYTPWLQTLALLVPSEITWRTHVTFLSLTFLICEMGTYGGDIHVIGYSESQIE